MKNGDEHLKTSGVRPRVLSVAPMIDWTDRHCRQFHRALTRHTWLYTEMITTGALIFGDRARFLRFDDAEHPVAFQLGGSDPIDLARCAAWVAQAGYDEVNLNCGCPSERVQKGSFGACLMAEPELVAQCVDAMRQACDLEVTVKHRIGLDYETSDQMVFDFVGKVSEAGCQTFIVHARNAVLKGLSPKENREIPPLRYDVVKKLKAHFPHLQIVLNGGIQTVEQICEILQWADGCMIGREAYGNPWLLTAFDALIKKKEAGLCFEFAKEVASAKKNVDFEDLESSVKLSTSNETTVFDRESVLFSLQPYVLAQMAQGESLRNLTRSWLGLFHGQPGGRLYRQVLSDANRLKTNSWDVVLEALEKIRV